MNELKKILALAADSTPGRVQEGEALGSLDHANAQAPQLLEKNRSQKLLEEHFEQNPVTAKSRKVSPPGLSGIESVTALGNTNASPISNYYCNGYQGQQKYTIDKLEHQARQQADRKDPSLSRRRRSLQRVRRLSAEVPAGADDKIRSSQFDMKQSLGGGSHANGADDGEAEAPRARPGLLQRKHQDSARDREHVKIDVNKHLQEIEAEKLLLRQLKEQLEDADQEKKPLVTRLDFGEEGELRTKAERARR